MDTDRDQRGRKRSLVSVERVLLAAILGMQLFIARELLRSKRSAEVVAYQPIAEQPAADDVALTVTPPPSRLPVPGVRMTLPSRDPFEGVGAMFADAFENMARLRSALQIDEGWDALSVSPTMDMRASDADYVVCFSIPDVEPSNVQVFLDGRILIVDAFAPVRGAHYTQMQRFGRRVRLPGPVGAADDAFVGITNGILRVQIPRRGLGQETPGVTQLF
ncbi:MAG: Hsp20 family protein [Verrucomicrobia bacterium]|jgi:HSP20 family molecular chaperone IbpA|nr:Hsp20 family protein [Verrucomicrobiota bacterium]MBT7067940.1 Hsp20 family protein [Verrucomicrobiota bacterium]MBT7700591.1 Hsp20 family protein [Verrucomicrobiota bacterium]